MEVVPLEIVTFNKLEVFVNGPRALVLHFLRNILQETRPFGRRAQLRDVIGTHLNALVGGHENTASGNVVHMVQVTGRSDRREIGRGLR